MSSVDQQIAQNRAKKKKLIVTGAIAGVSACLLVGVFVTLLVYFPAEDGTSSPVSQGKAQAKQASANSIKQPIDRKNLQTTLNAASQRVSEIAATPYLSNWKSASVESFQAAINQAFEDYGFSNYSQAKATLEQLTKDIDGYQAAFAAAYQQPYEEAATAFAESNIDEATRLNARALKIKGDFDDAQALQKRIDVYHEVADFYEQARVGAVEGNLEKQRIAYQQIVKLDPQRQDAEAQLSRLNQQIKEARFARALASAVDALDNEDLERGKVALAEATAIDNNRPELATLQAQLDASLRSRRLESLEQQIQVFAGADEWKTVAMLAEKGAADYPDSRIVQQAKQSANEILAANTALDVYLHRPDRLADNNIRQNAVSAISGYMGLTQLSDTLAAKIKQVELFIEQENQPIAVTVRSDNRTYIKVLGVGVVGEVREKNIQLKPGRYKFEGSRKGYRSTIVDVVVEKSDTPIVINIQCNERV